MTDRFAIQLLNMSFQAGVMTLIVIALRLLARRLPRGYSYALWGLVLFRLLCPIAVPSPFSLFPSAPPIAEEIIFENIPEIESGIIPFDRPVNQILRNTLAVKNPATSINPIQVAFVIFLLIWAAGAILFLLIHGVRYIRLKCRLADAVLAQEGVYETEAVDMPVVFGLIAPAIYLPRGLKEEVKGAVLAHERVHLRRRDYLIKFLAFLILAVHWFNPLIWLAFRLLDEDMEMSCDEQALRDLGGNRKKEYSQALLSFSAEKSGFLLPPAFGEGHTKKRIKNILNYKKPSGPVKAAALLSLLGAAAVFMTNPPVRAGVAAIIGVADGPTAIYLAGNLSESQNTVPVTPVSESEIKSQKLPLEMKVAQAGVPVSLDYADENRIVLHGPFGICQFERSEDGCVMTDSLDMAKADKRYGNNGYVPLLYYSGEELIIGYKTESGYEDPFWIYSDASGILVETEGGASFLEALEPFGGSAAPELNAQVKPFYGASILEDGRIGFLSADGAEVSSLWYGIYNEETEELVKTRLFS